VRVANALWRVDLMECLHGEYKTPGGKLVVADLRIRDGRLCDVQIAGDFFLFPDEAISRLSGGVEGSLVLSSVSARAAAIAAALLESDELVGVDPEAIAIAVERALREAR